MNMAQSRTPKGEVVNQSHNKSDEELELTPAHTPLLQRKATEKDKEKDMSKLKEELEMVTLLAM